MPPCAMPTTSEMGPDALNCLLPLASISAIGFQKNDKIVMEILRESCVSEFLHSLGQKMP